MLSSGSYGLLSHGWRFSDVISSVRSGSQTSQWSVVGKVKFSREREYWEHRLLLYKTLVVCAALVSWLTAFFWDAEERRLKGTGVRSGAEKAEAGEESEGRQWVRWVHNTLHQTLKYQKDESLGKTNSLVKNKLQREPHYIWGIERLELAATGR